MRQTRTIDKKDSLILNYVKQMNHFSLFLYGSRLDGSHRPTSDVDVLFIGASSVAPPGDIDKLIFDSLKITGLLNLDLKIYRLSDSSEKLAFPAAMIYQGAQLFYGPDVSSELTPPSTELFISLLKNQLKNLLAMTNTKDFKSFYDLITKSGRLKNLYNLVFTLSDIDFMVQNKKLHDLKNPLQGSHLKKAKELLRDKWNYTLPTSIDAQDQVDLKNLIVFAHLRIQELL